MARLRTLKPGFFSNEILITLDPYVRLLFAGLWCFADREGRLEDRPRKIKIDVFPEQVLPVSVDTMLNCLAEHEFIRRYRVGDSEYIQIVQFLRHQNPHKTEAPSRIPPPLDDIYAQMHSACTVPSTSNDVLCTVQAGMSLGSGELSLGSGGGGAPPPAATSNGILDPSDQWIGRTDVEITHLLVERLKLADFSDWTREELQSELRKFRSGRGDCRPGVPVLDELIAFLWHHEEYRVRKANNATRR